MNPASEEIIDVTNKFLWGQVMQDSLNSFAQNHAEMFVGVSATQGEEGEQRLEWTQAHVDFQELFELQLETFIEQQSFSTEEFLQACQDALDHGSWAGCGRAVRVVLGMADYDNFVSLMVEAAEEQAMGDAAWAADCGDEEEDLGAE